MQITMTVNHTEARTPGCTEALHQQDVGSLKCSPTPLKKELGLEMLGFVHKIIRLPYLFLWRHYCRNLRKGNWKIWKKEHQQRPIIALQA